jgi:hypothetical protein
MIRVAARDRMILQLAKATGEGDMLGLAENLVPQEQHLMLEQRGLDRAEQVIVPRGFGQVDSLDLGANVGGELLDAHQRTNTEEPMVLPASRSRWACTASPSS